jgi:hypothetical protein
MFFFFFFFIAMLGDTVWHLQRFLQCIKYIMLEFPPWRYPMTLIPNDRDRDGNGDGDGDGGG